MFFVSGSQAAPRASTVVSTFTSTLRPEDLLETLKVFWVGASTIEGGDAVYAGRLVRAAGSKWVVVNSTWYR